jgi:hypothetical protein
MAASYDLDQGLGPGFPLTDPGVGLVAAASFGDGIAAAFTGDTPSGGTQITLRAHAPQGGVLAQVSLPLGGPSDPDRLALLASPQGDSLLVAWTEVDPAQLAKRVQLARFDCASY